MDNGGNTGGRTYVSVSMNPSSMPPPLTTIPTTIAVGPTGPSVGGGTIVLTPTQKPPSQQARPPLRRKQSTNDQLTVVSVRNAAPPMITLSSTAPPLASFSNSNIKSPLPPAPPTPSLSSRFSIEQRTGPRFMRRNSTASTIVTPTGNREHPVPLLPKPATTVGGTAVSRPKVEIAKMDALPQAPPVQEIVIGRKEFMFPNSVAHEQFKQQQQPTLARFNSVKGKVSPGYTVQIGSTDMMTSHQSTKIGQTTILKQGLSGAAPSHIIPVGQSDPIGGTTATASFPSALLLPIQRTVTTLPQQITGVAEYKRIASPVSDSVKLYRSIYPKLPPMVQTSAFAATSLPSLTQPCPQVLTAVGVKAPSGIINAPAGGNASAEISESGMNVNTAGAALVVQSDLTVASAVPLDQQQLQLPEASFIPIKPGPVHQHVLPFGTTIKVTTAAFEQQQSMFAGSNSINPVVSAAGTSVIVPKSAQLQQPAVTNSITADNPSAVDSAANMNLQGPTGQISLIRPPVVTVADSSCGSAIPPLYVQPTAISTKQTVSVINALKTTSLSHTEIDGASGKLVGQRFITTSTDCTVGGAQQPQRIFVAANNNLVQQLKQHRTIGKKLSLPPVPKLAPFRTTIPQVQSVVPELTSATAIQQANIEVASQESNTSTDCLKTVVEAPCRIVDRVGVIQSGYDPRSNNTVAVLVKTMDTSHKLAAENQENSHDAEQHEVETNQSLSRKTVEMLNECAIEEHKHGEQTDGNDDNEQQERHHVDGDGILQSSNDESQHTTMTQTKESASVVYMEVSRLQVTPTKNKEKLDDGVPNGSRISPRLQKRSLSEQQRLQPGALPFKLEANMAVKAANKFRPNITLRKRSESVHVRDSLFVNEHYYCERNKTDKGTLKKFASIMKKSSALVNEPPTVTPEEGNADVDDGWKVKRLPLKDATNDATEESIAAPKVSRKPERKDTAVEAQGNVLLLCDEKFDLVSSSSVVDGDETHPAPAVRRTSRRLDSIRRGHGIALSSPTIKLDPDELTVLGCDTSVDPGMEGFASLDHSHSKSKKARMDENRIDFGHVRSNSTSSESNTTVKAYGRRSLPSSSLNVTGTAKKVSQKSKAAPGGGQSRVRQASIRSSIAGPTSESSFSVTEDKDSKDGGSGGQANADMTTVSDHLRWHDGIGYLDSSRLHFDFNEFGLVQPITIEQYERHCGTDVYGQLMIPMSKRDVSKKKKITNSASAGSRKRGEPYESRRSYRCIVCEAQGTASDFATPEYCSIECVQQSGKPAVLEYMKHSTHALQQRKLTLVAVDPPADGNDDEPEPQVEESPRSKKKPKRSSGETQQQSNSSEPATTGTQRNATPSTTTTTPAETTTNNTSDEDSRSSLSLNSVAFVKRPHLKVLSPASPALGDTSNEPTATPAATTGNNAETDNTLVDAEFNWDKYLRHVGAVAAPAELFGRQPYPTSTNNFRPGMKLEAIDPENCSLFCVCTVAEVRGFRIKLHFDGYPSDYDFWLNANSPDIFPPGWCRSTNRVLQPPSSYTNDATLVFRWKDYLRQTGATVPDHRWFAHVHKPPCTRNDFEIGMMLEADDLKKSGKVCVATVADKMGDRILVHFDGWDERYDYWVNIYSPYIHPMNWHFENNDKITPPPDWHKPFNWERYIRYKRHRIGSNQGRPIVPAPKELFQTRPPIDFKPGQRLEVVDRKQQIRIRPATVVAIDKYEVQVCFDGWPKNYAVWIEDDSPNLHPVNWCSRTRHPLEPPPNYLNAAELCDGTCEMRFCMGRGNAKFPNKKFHDRLAECPYKRSNWMGEFHKMLRISHNLVQKHITDVFSGMGLYQSADRRNLTKVKSVAAATPQARTDSPQPAQPPQKVSADTAVTVKRSSSTAATAAAGDGVPVIAKRAKKEQIDPSFLCTAVMSSSVGSESKTEVSAKERVVRNAKLSLDGRSVKEQRGRHSSTALPVPAPSTSLQEAAVRIALPAIEGYGPRLLHSYEVWRRNSRFLDEYTERISPEGMIRLKNPLNWTTEEMARYIEQVPGCDECAMKIRLEDINGRSFLSFTQDDLMKYMGIKVGPAIKVYNRIIHLRQLVTKRFIKLS